mmetsp:Transcript_81776/g.229363  ORF Transcript_81776/g.229363 Transcript_81776/m.229363 type:complete len:82 (+) Transcript_81776:1772-2017(+)
MAVPWIIRFKIAFLDKNCFFVFLIGDASGEGAAAAVVVAVATEGFPKEDSRDADSDDVLRVVETTSWTTGNCSAEERGVLD